MALSNTERQKRLREKAALEGSKSLSIGTIPIRYHKRFKELGLLAKAGTLSLDITTLEMVTPGKEAKLEGALRVSEKHLKEANEKREQAEEKTRKQFSEHLAKAYEATQLQERQKEQFKKELKIERDKYKHLFWNIFWR